MLVLLLACSPASPLVGESLTADGTWLLRLASTSYDAGRATLRVDAIRADAGEPAVDLRIFALPDMEEMAHTLEVVDFSGAGDGSYSSELLFDMPGLWTLSGYAGDDNGTEAFHFVVAVAP
jgi:hypothetical protein